MKRAVLAALLVACAPAAPVTQAPPLDVTLSTPRIDEPAKDPAASSSAEPAEVPCASDDACRLDPVTSRCGTQARFLAQPPIVDQGHLCFCDSARATCEHLRVLPVPCEADTSCAVQVSPRPHPVAASVEAPYRASVEHEGALYSVTCERTNICTMHRKAKGSKR